MDLLKLFPVGGSVIRLSHDVVMLRYWSDGSVILYPSWICVGNRYVIKKLAQVFKAKKFPFEKFSETTLFLNQQ